MKHCILVFSQRILAGPDQCLSRLLTYFSGPMTEIFLLFYQSVTSIFTRVHLLLQRDSPYIHFLYDDVLKKLLGHFLAPSAMDSLVCLFPYKLTMKIHHISFQIQKSWLDLVLSRYFFVFKMM